MGVELLEMSVYNYCRNDDNPVCSEKELEQMKIGYTFVSYLASDIRALQAYTEVGNSTVSNVLGDNLPVVIGEDFEEQMVIWFSVPQHQRFKDKQKTPGFNQILEIWKSGQLWGYESTGSSYFTIFDVWRRLTYGSIDNCMVTDEGWYDTVLLHLDDIDYTINSRLDVLNEDLKTAIKNYYNVKESN